VRRVAGALFAVAAGLVVLRLWIMPLPSSLWLDEFGTVWVTDGGAGRVLERARLFPQSVPYAALVATVRRGFGSSEVAVRLPSLAAMLAAAFLVLRLGRRSFGSEASWLAVGVFLLFPGIEFAASDARPYAFAVLFAAAALLALSAWFESGRLRDGAAYVLCAAAAISFQYLFAPILAGHAVYVLRRRRRGSPVSDLALAGAAAALAALLVPAAILVREIRAQRRAHSFGVLPDALGLLNALVPFRVLGLLVPASALVLLVLAGRGWRATSETAGARDAVLLLLSAAAAPPLALFAVSHIAGTPVFEGRYLLATAAPWAVLLGGLLAGLKPAGAGRLALAGALVLALVLRGEPGRLAIAHGREDWRGALDAVRSAAPGAPVLLAGSFAESRDLTLVGDPRHQDYLVAPVRTYAPGTMVRALPLEASPAADAEAERLADGILEAPRLVLVERRSRFPSRVEWLDGRLRPRGYAARELWREGPLAVRLYEAPGTGN
jgi:mannosyltransferase